MALVPLAVPNALPRGFGPHCRRCPVFVFDICRVVAHLARLPPGAPAHNTYNLGGPDRMSRVDMAVAVARHFGYDLGAIVSIPSAEAGDRCGAAALRLPAHAWGPAGARLDCHHLQAASACPSVGSNCNRSRRRRWQTSACTTRALHPVPHSPPPTAATPPPPCRPTPHRGYQSPPDISMVMDRLRQDLPSITLTSFAQGLALIFPNPPKQ
jgi:hypothetical protein